jgi:regulator of replication initiation timing
MVNSENLFSKISTLETEIYSLNRKISLLSAKVDQLQVGEKADLKEDNENPS